MSKIKPKYLQYDPDTLKDDDGNLSVNLNENQRFVTDTEKSTWDGKQNALVSGTNIKTVGGVNILGSGDVEISSGVNIINASTPTAASTVAKVATTTGGNYVPAINDIIALTFTTANTANAATLNIDGSGAKPIKLNGSTTTNVWLIGAAGGTTYLIYDGTSYNVFGSQRNSDTNTTYSEITEAEITTGTASTARAITARRMKFALDSRLGVYSIQKDGTDGAGIINFKTS